jgi:hypothetical protein
VSWARFDDNTDDELAFLGPEAFRLFVCGITYSRRNARAGRLHQQRDVIPLAGKLRLRDLDSALAELLTSTGADEALWLQDGDVFVIRNYEKFNPLTSRERTRLYRERRHGDTPVTSQPVTGDAPSRARQRAGSPVPEPVPSIDASHLTPPPPETGAVAQVFEAWKTAAGKNGNTVLTTERRQKIRLALKSYPLADVLDAVVGWRHVPHNRGENSEGQVWNELTLLLRNAEHIERFRDAEREAGVRPKARETVAWLPPVAERPVTPEELAGGVASVRSVLAARRLVTPS